MKKVLFIVVGLLSTWPLRHAAALDLGEQVKLTLLDHVMAVGQVVDGGVRTAAVDSVILIGNHNRRSILDIQAGVVGDTREGENPKWITGAFLKVSTLIRDKIKFADHWRFLNSLEYGIGYMHDWTTDTAKNKDYVCLQIGMAFSANPK